MEKCNNNATDAVLFESIYNSIICEFDMREIWKSSIIIYYHNRKSGIKEAAKYNKYSLILMYSQVKKIMNLMVFSYVELYACF